MESNIGFFGLKIVTSDIGRFTQIDRTLILIEHIWILVAM